MPSVFCRHDLTFVVPQESGDQYEVVIELSEQTEVSFLFQTRFITSSHMSYCFKLKNIHANESLRPFVLQVDIYSCIQFP